MNEAPTEADLLAGNMADRRRAARWQDIRSREWLEGQVASRPELGIYWMGLVCQVYLASLIWPVIREPGPGRWMTLALLGPLLLLSGALVYLTGKLAKLAYRLDARGCEEAEVAAVLAERTLRQQAAATQALEASHDPLQCPGPPPGSEGEVLDSGGQRVKDCWHDCFGTLFEITWICPTCELRWEWRGLWVAP